MRKISDITSTATPGGEFTNGSVASGVSPTILDAEWFNVIQRELVNIVQSAGLPLDASNDKQVLTALQGLFGSLESLKKKQPLDATLTALAALATGSDKLPYFNGVDTVTQTDLTSVGREIIGKSAVADVLSYLGLEEAQHALSKTKNLSDLSDKVAARKNLGLGDEATVSLGVNQRWQVMTSSRSTGVTYTNTTGKPIQLLLDFVRPNTSWVVNVQIDGVSVSGAGGYCPVIPSNSTYRVDASGIANLTWRELR